MSADRTIGMLAATHAGFRAVGCCQRFRANLANIERNVHAALNLETQAVFGRVLALTEHDAMVEAL
jgi:hypothetical protein